MANRAFQLKNLVFSPLDDNGPTAREQEAPPQNPGVSHPQPIQYMNGCAVEYGACGIETQKGRSIVKRFVFVFLGIVAVGLLGVIVANSTSADKDKKNPVVVMETSMGTIKIELYADK